MNRDRSKSGGDNRQVELESKYGQQLLIKSQRDQSRNSARCIEAPKNVKPVRCLNNGLPEQLTFDEKTKST